jgi:hypothetical protein
MAWAIAAVTVMAAGTAAYFAWAGADAPAPAVTRSVIEAGQTIPVSPVNSVSFVSISPDGRRVAFLVGQPSGARQLLVRSLEVDAPLVVVPAATDGGAPVFSPDGQWLIFTSANRLMKVAATGGAPVVLGSAEGALSGATWTDDGWIVYATGNSRGLYPWPRTAAHRSA